MTRIKSAKGVPTGSASRLLTRAALTWFGSYQGDGAGAAEGLAKDCDWRYEQGRTAHAGVELADGHA